MEERKERTKRELSLVVFRKRRKKFDEQICVVYYIITFNIFL